MALPTQGKRIVMNAPGGPDKLQYTDFTLPAQVAKGYVRISVTRSTATYTDLLVINGNYIPQFPFPVTPGYDLVGHVVGIGADVTSFTIGDLVASMPQHGGHTTLIDLPERLVV